MQNIEFKAELRDIEAARMQCAALGAQQLGRAEQRDTYYRMPDGRLKRREIHAEPTQWIFYHRADRTQPKLSNYTILTDEQARNRWGTHSLREWLVVHKVRELWLLESIRIHLDDVADLGFFVEFEAMLTPQVDIQGCHVRIAELREAFGAVLGEAISMSYSDLLEQHRQLSTQ